VNAHSVQDPLLPQSQSQARFSFRLVETVTAIANRNSSRPRPIVGEQPLVLTQTDPSRPFDEAEALTWLRSRPDGRITASAAELSRQWGWNRMRAGRRLRAWQNAGYIQRNAGEIVVTTSVTPAVTEAAGLPYEANVTRRSMSPVKLAAFIVELVLACVSAAFSIDGLTAIFAGAFWPVIIMGAALEAGKLVAAAWLTENWRSAPHFCV